MLNFQGLFVRGIYFIINSRVNGRLDLQDYFHEAKGLEQIQHLPTTKVWQEQFLKILRQELWLINHPLNEPPSLEIKA